MLKGKWQYPDSHQCTQCYSSLAKAETTFLFCKEMPKKITVFTERLYWVHDSFISTEQLSLSKNVNGQMP